MQPFRLRPDLTRAVIDGFAFPLGIVPHAIDAPVQGYTVEYAPGSDDEPDCYSFYVVVSHERIAALMRAVFELLPRDLFAVVEIGSRDAYRSVDVYMTQEPMPRRRFERAWMRYEAFLLEDASIGAGANCEDPFIEIFLDQWKGLWIHVPLSGRARVERVLERVGLREVPETWPENDNVDFSSAVALRNVLDLDDPYSPDVDQVLLELRRAWDLELNVDPETNTDEGGRELGLTLWHAVAVVESARNPEDGAYALVWATAASLGEMEDLLHGALARYPDWRFVELYSIDRVAFDERPDELTDLPPRREHAGVHLVSFDAWSPEADDQRRSVKGGAS